MTFPDPLIKIYFETITEGISSKTKHPCWSPPAPCLLSHQHHSWSQGL